MVQTKGTAERALTACNPSKDSAGKQRSQFSNIKVQAKGTAERAFTRPCSRNKNESQFLQYKTGPLSGHLQSPAQDPKDESVLAIQNGTAERALTGWKSSNDSAERQEISFQT